MNPLTAASMATAVGVARDVSADAPKVLWPADWPPPELVAWTLAEMLAETVPAAARDDTRPHAPAVAAA